MEIKNLNSRAVYIAGSFDNAKRWIPNSEFMIDGSFMVRCPSRAYPFSYLKHFQSIKYRKMLKEARPDLYKLITE